MSTAEPIHDKRRTPKPPRKPVPAPVVGQRPAEMSEIPKTARALAVLGYKHGWEVSTTYARGTNRVGKGKDKVVDSIAVRMRRPGIALTALWLDGRFDTGIWASTCTANLTLVQAMVKSGPLREVVVPQQLEASS